MEDLEAVNSPINQEADDSLINQLLVDPCLEHIFSFLPILERIEIGGVCRRWRTIGKRGWNDKKKLVIDRGNPENTVHLILQRCGRFLKELIIWMSSKHPNCLTMIMEYCKLNQLKNIAIIFDDERTVEDLIRDLREIFQRARKLVAVSIHSRGMSYATNCLNHLNSEILQRLHLDNWVIHAEPNENKRLLINPDRFPNLIELVLQHMEISDDGMKREEKGSLKILETLDLHNCVIPQSFSERIKTLSNLQELTLELNNCDLRNNHIRGIAEHCDKIKEMHIKNCSNVTSVCFEHLGRMPSLETFEWEPPDNVNKGNFIHLVNVRHLMLFINEDFRNGHELIELIANASNLEELTLWFFDGLNTALINNIRQIFHRGQRQKHLYLKIKDFNVYGNELELSDHSLLTILHTDLISGASQ